VHSAVDKLPVSEKKIKKKNRWIIFLIIVYKNKIALHQRGAGDIWSGLFDFPSMEFVSKQELEAFIKKISPKSISKKLTTRPNNIIEMNINQSVYIQVLTHQKIHARTVRIILNDPTTADIDIKWIPASKINTFAFPRIIRDIIQEELTLK
jgi:A/G-specific adenine glycosylase